MAVGAVTITAALLVQRLSVRLPATMIAIVAGMATFAVLRESRGPGEVLSAFHGNFISNSPLPVLLQCGWGGIWSQVWVDVCVPAVLIATVGSVLTLLSAVILDAATGSNQDGDRTLLTQGMSNICSAAIGGIFVGGANVMSLANFQSGGRTAFSGITLSLIFVGILFGGGAVFNFLPVAVLAGIMIAVVLNILEDLHRVLGFRAQGGNMFGSSINANTAIIVLVGATTGQLQKCAPRLSNSRLVVRRLFWISDGCMTLRQAEYVS